MKKLIALCLTVVTGLSLVACGGSKPAATTAAPAETTTKAEAVETIVTAAADAELQEEITIIIDNNKIDVLDPARGNTNTDKWAFNMMYDRLFTTEMDGTIIPELAEDCKTEDYQSYELTLKEGIKFTNGEPFTADDVAFTIERGKESVGTAAQNIWSKIDSYEVVDDSHINFTLKSVNLDFTYELTLAHAGILNREACEKDAENGAWVTTGPWKAVECVSNDYSVFEVNEDYWGEVPKTKKITLKYVAEEATRLIMLENDEVDAAFSINPNDFPYMEEDDRFDTYAYTVNNCSFLAFNMDDPITGDINFRHAVNLAINRPEIVAYRGKYIVPAEYGTFWGYGTEFKNTDLKNEEQNLELAKEYLAKTAYNGEEIEIVCAFSDLLNMSQVIQQELAQIGINIKINQTDAPGMNAYTTWDNYQAQIVCYTGAWTGVASSCRPYFYKQGASNRAHWSDPEVEALIDQAMAETDDAKREALYKEVQVKVAEAMPYLNLGNLTHVVGTRAGVSGMRLNADASHDLTYIVREIR